MGNPLQCTEISPECTLADSIYGYYPSLAANAFFLAWFALFLILNLVLGLRYKTWSYMVAMCLACVAEALGYVGRILLHHNPYDSVGFEIQICCLILAPAFNSAAIYLVFKHVAICFGAEWSRFRPKYYTWIFITFDILALILQGAGGGIAATANDPNMLNVGDDLMMTGISWQVATLLVFGTMVGDYAFRRLRDPAPLSPAAEAKKKSVKFRVFCVGLFIAYLAIFARCVYRIAEMAGGWSNPIMQDQSLFIGLDGS